MYASVCAMKAPARALLASLVLSLCVSGCASSGDDKGDLGTPNPDQGPTNPLVAARPYESRVPDSYDSKKPTPLVILLHGYGASGLVQDLYFGFSLLYGRFGFLYAFPDGTTDSQGKQFWNANDVCCDFNHTGVDDVAYIDAIISDMSAHYNVDPQRIYLVGHSNGGFMSHRYACDRANRVAAIVSLAGAVWKDQARCQPSEPVAVLEVHGDKDDSVPYAGSTMGAISLPSAEETVSDWATKNGCTGAVDRSAAPLDLESMLAGAETRVDSWPGCKPGGAAALWTIQGGSHVPTFNRPTWGEQVWGWLAAHPKPQHP